MLNFSTFNLIFFFPCFSLFSLIWYSYFLLNFTSNSNRHHKKDFIKTKSTSLVINYSRYSNFFFLTPVFFYVVTYLVIIKNYESFFFFRHIFISNFLFSLFFLYDNHTIFFILLFFQYFKGKLYKQLYFGLFIIRFSYCFFFTLFFFFE